jgi:sugar lactone lactonase YvrE
VTTFPENALGLERPARAFAVLTGRLLADDLLTPNGLAFSPDETIQYLNNSRRGHIRAFGFLPKNGRAIGADCHGVRHG